MINAPPCGIIGTEKDRIFFCLIVLRVKRMRAQRPGRRKDSGGGQGTKKTERSPRRRGRRRFSYNSRKLCRSLEARSRVTWNRRFVPCSCICKLRTNNIHAWRSLFPVLIVLRIALPRITGMISDLENQQRLSSCRVPIEIIVSLVHSR